MSAKICHWLAKFLQQTKLQTNTFQLSQKNVLCCFKSGSYEISFCGVWKKSHSRTIWIDTPRYQNYMVLDFCHSFFHQNPHLTPDFCHPTLLSLALLKFFWSHTSLRTHMTGKQDCDSARVAPINKKLTKSTLKLKCRS